MHTFTQRNVILDDGGVVDVHVHHNADYSGDAIIVVDHGGGARPVELRVPSEVLIAFGRDAWFDDAVAVLENLRDRLENDDRRA